MEYQECDYGCRCSRCDPEYHEYLRWKRLEPWYAKYKSGELKAIPSDIWEAEIKRPASDFVSALNSSPHPAIEAFFVFKYEDVSLFDFLNILSSDE